MPHAWVAFVRVLSNRHVHPCWRCNLGQGLVPQDAVLLIDSLFGDENVFTKEQFDAYAEPTELGAFLADPAAPKDVGRRVGQIRKLFK